MKKLGMSLFTACVLMFGTVALSAADTAPKSIIHVVTLKWKPGTTPEQIKAALDGVQALPSQYKGITRVWTNAIKVQGEGITHAFVMEFADAESFKAYTDSAAQKKWYEVYLPIRGQSTTFDITN